VRLAHPPPLSKSMSEQEIAIPGTNAAVPGIAVGIETPVIDVATEPTPAVAFSFRTLDVLKWIFSFPAFLAALLVGLVFYTQRSFTVDPDMWWHIKTGETILATHHWPTADPYSFTAFGQPWIAFEWLGDTLLAMVSRMGGLRGLELLLIVLGSAVLLSLYLLATISSNNSKAGFVAAALVCPLASATFSLRPQMLGFLFLVFTLIALELFRQGRQWALWMLPPLFLIWVNTHGTWIVGLGTIFVYWVCGLKKFKLGGIEAVQWSPLERLRISLVFLLSLVAITITPYGTELTAFPVVRALAFPMGDANVSEWMPILAFTGLGKFFLVLIFGSFILQIALGMAWGLQELVLFLGSAVLTFLHARFVLVFAPFFVLLLGRVLSRWLQPYSPAKDKYVINGILMAGLLAAMIHYFPTRADLEQKVADRFPVQAVEYLRQHPAPGPMFDSYFFGGYLVWSLGPGQKVFIDGRSELYEGAGVLAEYLDISHLNPGGLSVLRRHHIQACLLQRNEMLATVLSALPDWRIAYSDHTSILFVRRNPLPAPATRTAEGSS
jgi:hypothetical protein